MADSVNLLESFLKYCSDKSKVINQNIANVNTEGYKRKDVDFNAYLKNHLNTESKSAQTNHLGNTTGNEVEPNGIIAENKDVTIEEEMAELAKNTINFKFASKRISSYYKNLQSVIKSGG